MNEPETHRTRPGGSPATGPGPCPRGPCRPGSSVATTPTGEASEAMANPSPGDSAKDLFGDWNLQESAEGPGQAGSRLAFNEPRPRNRLDEDLSHRPWGIGAGRPAPDADLFRDFSINEDDEPD